MEAAGEDFTSDRGAEMCEFCTKHGDGKVWYKNAENYSRDLLSDIRRRAFIRDFLSTTIKEGFDSLGRLEALYMKKGRLPDSLIRRMEGRAKAEHFGQVLPLEEISELVLKADTIVRMPCACRWTAKKKEIRCCYGVSYGPEAWYREIDMSYFGKASAEGLESVEREEAVRQIEEMEDYGAVHTIWTMVTPFIGAICNCAAHDCIAMRTLSGIGVETMARAEYVAVVDEELCEGCGLCYERCQFGAIASVREGGRITSRTDRQRCFGCGLCRTVCGPGAIRLITR
jgi:NAD-dependent dihydropyrimidine dehydrogenase PreA subunit